MVCGRGANLAQLQSTIKIATTPVDRTRDVIVELAILIEALSDPQAYPFAIDTVEIRQTHISVVFLAGRFVYKIKKPVNLGYLDFTTLDKRRHFCDEEVRLNRRLALGVYLGVVPVVRHGTSITIEGPGEVLEWAVKMERLPGDATLQNHVQRGIAGAEVLSSLARKIAAFHAQSGQGPHIAACAGSTSWPATRERTSRSPPRKLASP